MASGKTPMTDTVNALRKKHGLHCATNPDGLTRPKADASVEDRDAFAEADSAYRKELQVANRKLFRGFVNGQRTALDPAERREYQAGLRAKQIAAAAERR